jgi:glutamate-1-semialdehyde 2,1-aminomutase
MVLGHSPPTVIEALNQAVASGLGFGAPSTLEAEMSEEIVKRFPSIEKVRFTNSGTESSLHATRMARAVTGRPKVAKFEGAYHGSHDALEVSVAPPIDRAGPDDSPNAVASWPGMAQSAEEDVVILPYGQLESVELILREQKDEIAAVFFDGKPGIYDVDPGLAPLLRNLTRELGMVMVMDEVVSFRAGYGGYQSLVGVEPDLTLFAKIMGGGMPGGVIGGSSELMDLLDSSSETYLNQSGTFSGNHLTLAAGLATLRALTPEAYEHLDALRERLVSGLRGVFHRAGVQAQVRGVGSIVSFDLVDRPVTDYRSLQATDRETFELVRMEALLKGYFIAAGLGLCLCVPMGPEHIDGLVETIENALAAE